MSEHTHTAPVVKIPVITRNGVALELKKQAFGKKSPNVGKSFFAPVIDINNVDDVKWVGADDINGFVNKNLRAISGGIYLDNIDEKTGVFNYANWELEMAEFSAGVDKLSDLEDELDALQGEQQSIVLDDRFGEVGDNGEPTEYATELSTRAKAIAQKIKPIRIKRDSITEKYKARAAARKAKEEASTTKTAAPANVQQ